jgi:hypothetical protein
MCGPETCGNGIQIEMQKITVSSDSRWTMHDIQDTGNDGFRGDHPVNFPVF